MTQIELHFAAMAAAEALANEFNFSAGEESMKQNFLLGSYLPNPNNLVQDKVWRGGIKSKVEFRHRFSNICIEISANGQYAGIEFNLDELGRPYICETHTIGAQGMGFLSMLLDKVKIS